MSDRFEAKSVYEVYSFGFFQGREYEALDTLKAMNAVGDFEVIQRDVVDGFEAVIAARISAAVAAEREAAREHIEKLIVAARDGYGHADERQAPGKCSRCDAVREAAAWLRGGM